MDDRTLRHELQRRRLNAEAIAGLIDNTFLRAEAPESEAFEFCRRSAELGLGAVAVASGMVALARCAVGDRPTLVCSAIAFPLGSVSTYCKLAEVRDALASGADELDFVINISKVRSGDYEFVGQEMRQIVLAAQGHTTKAILETCLLRDEEITAVAREAVEAGVTFVKTSTGFREGTTVEHVRLIARSVGGACGMKATGGIRTLEQTLQMLEAGATRIGTSSGVAIVESALRAMAGS